MKQDSRGRVKRRSHSEWRALLAKFASSGLDVGEFCRREAISAASLYRWRTLLGEAAQGGQNVARAATPAFLDLGTLNSAAASRPRLDLTLELGDGLSLHLVRH
jgi:transposase-like protein